MTITSNLTFLCPSYVGNMTISVYRFKLCNEFSAHTHFIIEQNHYKGIQFTCERYTLMASASLVMFL